MMYPNLYQYQQQPYQPTNQLIRVAGIEAAKAYQMPANGTLVLFDNGSDIMYVKTTDSAGFPSIRTFAFTEIKDEPTTTQNDYVSKEEFEQFKKEVKEYGKQFISRPKQKAADVE